MKKLTSLILSAALILSILPAAFAAAGSIEDDLADTTRIYSSIPDKTALLIETMPDFPLPPIIFKSPVTTLQ